MKQAVYLVAVDNGMVSVLQDESGYSLPGGLCGEKDSHELFLMRFCLEKTGYDISVEDFICEERQGDTVEYYYSGSLIDAVTDGKPFPAIPLTQLTRLTSPAQRRATEECLAMMRSDAQGSEDADL